MSMKENGGLYLSECKVNGKDIKDSQADDGWYHYGTRDLTNEEYVDMYGKAIELALKEFGDEHNSYPNDISLLTIDYSGKNTNCDITINPDGTVYLTKCSVNNNDVVDENSDDNYYHYGRLVRGTDILIKKANNNTVTNYNDGDIHEMYTISHSVTEQTGALTDYRYIGNVPYNYITFNNELWRIIGIFTVEDANGNMEERIKIIRNDYILSGVMWAPYSNGGYWTFASINSYLNDTYYNSIDEKDRLMIGDAKFYLETKEYLGHPEVSFTGVDYYEAERGNVTYNNRDTNWIGKIGLMYPSDFIYVNALGYDDIYFNNTRLIRNSNNWIKLISNNSKWTITPVLNHQFVIIANLRVEQDYADHQTNVTIPVLYLKSQVKIVSGDGSREHPYQLNMKNLNWCIIYALVLIL